MPHVLDADGVVFFKKQLDHIKAKTFDVLYPGVTFRRVFPINTETPEAAGSITTQFYDQAGEAAIVGNGAKDIPRADVAAGESTKVVRNLAVEFGYTFFEIQAARQTGVALDQKKANAARGAIERKMNRIAYLGDDEYSIDGLLTDTNVPSGNAPNGSWSSASDVDDIIDDVLDAFNQIFVDSNGIEMGNRLLVTPEQYALLSTMRLSSTTDQILLDYLVKNVQYLNSVNDVIVVPELIGAGTAGVDVMIAMTANPDKLEFEIPMDVTFLEEERRGLNYVTDVIARCAGLNIHYPGSIYISEGL